MKPLKPSDPPRIGPFRIVARLGAGGMGTVYLGRAESTGKAVAIKTIHGDLVTDREFRARFSREVSAARQVRGTYIAEVVDADPEAANPWLATAYSPGISVGDAVHRSGPLPAEAVRKLGLCVARAVADIHAVGLVHRDLKPDNVLLTSTGPKVIDFGIARGVAEDGLTRTGMVAGSPPYMAPEQLLTGDFGTGSDVFGLGAILHFAATGVGPYGRGGVNELYGRAITIGPVIDESLPESLSAPLRSCLTKEPSVRPDAAGLARMLEESPSEDPGTGWLPGAVMEEILAQATEALSAESSAASAPPQQQPQQQPLQGRPYVPPRPDQIRPGPQQQPAMRPPQNFPQQGQPPQQRPPQQGYPQATSGPRPQAGPQAGPQRPPSWPNNPAQNNPANPNTPAHPNNPANPNNQANQANQANRGSGSGPNWSLGGNPQQPGPTRPPLPAPQYQPRPQPMPNTPPRPVVNTPPPFGVQPQQQRPVQGQPMAQPVGQYGQRPNQSPNPYAVAAGLPGYVAPRNRKALWGMVLALIAIPGLVVPYLNLLLAGAGIVLGISGNAEAVRTRIGKGQAMTGIVVGTVMLILAIWLDIEFAKGAFDTSTSS